MTSFKSNGIQKRGAGFKETQRGIWILSLPISSTFNLKMLELTDKQILKYVDDARISRDSDDIRNFLFSLIGSVATSVVGKEVEKRLPTRKYVKLSCKDEATFVSDLLS